MFVICKADVSLLSVKLRCYGFVFHMLIETLQRYLIHLYNRKVNEVSSPM